MPLAPHPPKFTKSIFSAFSKESGFTKFLGCGPFAYIFFEKPTKPPNFVFLGGGVGAGPALAVDYPIDLMILFFPYKNPTPTRADKPPWPSHPRELDFGPFRLRFGPFRVRLALFGSISGLFRVRFGSVGWGRGEGLCK